ncbi:hypothetical protein HZA39_00650 [Candidatus Peregrinibacteria bacterium]|nr:hypothetical protein [Candidatus Peregrinibacteria bacterium]
MTKEVKGKTIIVLIANELAIEEPKDKDDLKRILKEIQKEVPEAEIKFA